MDKTTGRLAGPRSIPTLPDRLIARGRVGDRGASQDPLKGIAIQFAVLFRFVRLADSKGLEGQRSER